MMKVKIFSSSWQLYEIEDEINAFLKTLHGRGIVKEIKTNMAPIEESKSDDASFAYIVSIWYEDIIEQL